MATKAFLGDPLWRWRADLAPDLQQTLLEAIQTNMVYARRCAWAELRDLAMTEILMDESLEALIPYLTHCSPAPAQFKIEQRLRSQIRRVAKQISHGRRLEEATGSLYDLASLADGGFPDPTETLLLERIWAELTPQAREVAEWRHLGYSWRDIAKFLEVAESTVRYSFRREADDALRKLGKGARVVR